MSITARELADKPLVVPFPGSEGMPRAEVGGKAATLIRMVEAGLPVPAGAILTRSFFVPWFDDVQASSTWAQLIVAPPGDWAPLCDRLKERARTLPLTIPQHDALDALARQLGTPDSELRFAVRSSSPRRDEGAGVTARAVEPL